MFKFVKSLTQIRNLSSMRKFVLTGVDGNLGRHAAAFVAENKQPDQEVIFTTYKKEAVPAKSIDLWAKKGITLKEATYDDVGSLIPIFQDAEAITFISTWLFGEGRRHQAANVLEAAKKANVKRVCYTSFVGGGINAKDENDIPFLPRDHHFIEQLVLKSGLDYNIQRNWLYMDNIPFLFAQSWKFEGNRWLNNTHGVPGAYVAREDAGRVAGALLLGKGEPNKIYDVTGPEAVTDKEIFDWMNARTGYKAEFVDMPDPELRAWWLDHGLPKDVYGDFSKIPMKLCIGDVMCCGEMLADGHMKETSDTVEKLTGQKPKGYKEALLAYEDMFPKPE